MHTQGNINKYLEHQAIQPILELFDSVQARACWLIRSSSYH